MLYVAVFLSMFFLSTKYITAGSKIETADVIAANKTAIKNRRDKYIPIVPIS